MCDSGLERPTLTSCPALSPVCAAVSALCVGEVRLQEHVLVDPSHQAVDVRGHLLLTLHQGQHNVQGLLPVARQVPPRLTHMHRNTTKAQRHSMQSQSGRS